jgi:hypothetical protein
MEQAQGQRVRFALASLGWEVGRGRPPRARRRASGEICGRYCRCFCRLGEVEPRVRRCGAVIRGRDHGDGGAADLTAAEDTQLRAQGVGRVGQEEGGPKRAPPGLSRWSSMGPFPLAPSVKSAAAALAAATSSSGPVTSTMRRSKSCSCSQSPSVMPRSVQPRTQRILSANRQAKPPENRPTHQSRQCFACCR